MHPADPADPADPAALLLSIPEKPLRGEYHPDTVDRILSAVALTQGAVIPEVGSAVLRSNTRYRFYARPADRAAAERQVLHAREVLTKHGCI